MTRGDWAMTGLVSCSYPFGSGKFSLLLFHAARIQDATQPRYKTRGRVRDRGLTHAVPYLSSMPVSSPIPAVNRKPCLNSGIFFCPAEFVLKMCLREGTDGKSGNHNLCTPWQGHARYGAVPWREMFRRRHNQPSPHHRELATLLHFAGEQEKEHAKAARRQAAVNEATSERPERSAGSITGRYNRPH